MRLGSQDAGKIGGLEGKGAFEKQLLNHEVHEGARRLEFDGFIVTLCSSGPSW